MDVEIRFYKIYDADLISLAMAGYPLSTMMRDAVCAFANGNSLLYYVDEQIDADFNNMKSVHTRFTIPKSDEKTIYMIKNIKHRCRNQFCKAVLRNSILQQNLSVFFSSESARYLLPVVSTNASIKDVQHYTNAVPLSTLKQAAKQIMFAGKTVTAESSANPFEGNEPVPMPVIQTPAASAPEEVYSPPPSEEDFTSAETYSEPINIPVQKKNTSPSAPADESAFDALDKLMGNDFD